MPTSPTHPGYLLQGNRHYIVRWQEGGYWHQRYFNTSNDAETYLTYVKQYDPNAYAATIR